MDALARWRRARSAVLVAVLAVTAAACGGDGPPPSPAPASPSAATGSPSAATASAEAGQATATPEPVATPSPSSAPVTGTWRAPRAGRVLGEASLTLAADVPAPAVGAEPAKVVFSVAWDDRAPVTACTARRPAADGSWSCTADLWAIGARLGRLTLAFDIVDADGARIPAPDGTRTVKFAAPPPRPADASYKLVSKHVLDPEYADTDWVYRVKWSSPDGAADEFTIWIVTGCYAKHKGDPCVAEGMHIPDRDRDELVTVAGSVRSYLHRFSTGWEAFWEDVPKAIIIQAHNAYGYSKSAIAWSLTCDGSFCP